jgi:glucose/arabinose dehydrogenase
MKKILNITAITIVLLLMFIVDIPLLPVELVPEAQAIFGVRRRTAVVAYSAGKANASASASSQQTAAAQQQAAAANQQAAAAQQQAATANQEAAAAQQQLAAAQTTSSVPLGTVVEALPAGCIAVTVGNTQYQDCNGSFYRTSFQGNKLIYVVVQKPL